MPPRFNLVLSCQSKVHTSSITRLWVRVVNTQSRYDWDTPFILWYWKGVFQIELFWSQVFALQSKLILGSVVGIVQGNTLMENQERLTGPVESSIDQQTLSQWYHTTTAPFFSAQWTCPCFSLTFSPFPSPYTLCIVPFFVYLYATSWRYRLPFHIPLSVPA